MELQDQWGVTSLHGMYFIYYHVHPLHHDVHLYRQVFIPAALLAQKSLLVAKWKEPPQCHRDTTSGSRQGCKTLQQVISSLPILSLAGSNSVVPAGESVESLVWILCPVRDGACRADSGFHCHHLYPVLPLVPLMEAALLPSTTSKQPQQRCLPRRGIGTQCSTSLHC